MKLSFLALSLLLQALVADQAFVEIDGDAFVLPTERITADLLLSNPVYETVNETELPPKFWMRQRRSDLAKLTKKYGIAKVIRRLDKALPEGNGTSQLFSKDGDFLLVTNVIPTMQGPRFTTAFDDWFNPETFKFSQTDLELLRQQSQHLMGKLRMGPVLANLGQEDLFHLTRFYFPHLETFAANQEQLVQMIRQSITNLLIQLERNDPNSPKGNLWKERESLVTMIFQNSARLNKYFADWQLVAGPETDQQNLTAYVAGQLTEHHFLTELTEGDRKQAVTDLLKSGWADYSAISKLLEKAVDEYGLDIMSQQSWELLRNLPQLERFETLVIAGVVLGSFSTEGLPNKSHLDRLVRKQAFEALWIGQSPEAIKAIARPFSWIAVNHPSVLLPSKVLRMLAADSDAAVLAKECLLKHLVIDGDRHVLLPWFFKLFGEGKAKFHVTEELKTRMMSINPEIGFLAFPEAFDMKPPASFSKAMLMELVASGPVDGTLRTTNNVVSKLIELRMDAMNLDELYTVMEWARKSHLSYVIGKQLYELIRKDDQIPTLMKRMTVGLGQLEEWEGFPLAADGTFTLDTYRAIFTWIPYELDAEILQKFELFSTDLTEMDIAFMLKTTPFRPRVQQILKRQYMFLTERKVGAVLRFEDILREHANDVPWLVELARCHWDPTDLSLVREVFLAHGFSDTVWRLIRFTPQEQVEEYLATIRRFNNVPFAFLEHLRVERGMSPKQIVQYVEENISNPQIL